MVYLLLQLTHLPLVQISFPPSWFSPTASGRLEQHGVDSTVVGPYDPPDETMEHTHMKPIWNGVN